MQIYTISRRTEALMPFGLNNITFYNLVKTGVPEVHKVEDLLWRGFAILYVCLRPTNMKLPFTRGTMLYTAFIKLVDLLEIKSKMSIIAES